MAIAQNRGYEKMTDMAIASHEKRVFQTIR